MSVLYPSCPVEAGLPAYRYIVNEALRGFFEALFALAKPCVAATEWYGKEWLALKAYPQVRSRACTFLRTELAPDALEQASTESVLQARLDELLALYWAKSPLHRAHVNSTTIAAACTALSISASTTAVIQSLFVRVEPLIV